MKLCPIFPSWSDPSDRLSKAKEKTIWDEKDHIILGLKPQSIFRPEKMLEIWTNFWTPQVCPKGTGHRGWFHGGLLILLKLSVLFVFFVVYHLSATDIYHYIIIYRLCHYHHHHHHHHHHPRQFIETKPPRSPQKVVNTKGILPKMSESF